MHIIGIDLGTSKICGVAYDIDRNQIAYANRLNDSTITTFNNWEKIQNPQRIYELVEQILSEFTSKFQDIIGIGITGQMHGILYVDDNGEPLSPLYTWQDGRGNLIYHDGQTYASFLSSKTKYMMASGYGIVTHFYNIKNNLVPEKAKKICTIMDFVSMKLSENKIPISDSTNLASLGFFDIANLKFDDEKLIRCGINPSILPEISRADEKIGYFRGSIPVFTAIGDNQASFLGSISDLKKSILINIGTSGQISAFYEEFIKVDNLELDIRPFPGGGFILVGASLCGGNSLNILKGLFEDTLQTFCGCGLKTDIFFSIANSINLSSFPEENRLYVKTLFEGSRNNPKERGSIQNISSNNLSVRNLIVGFFEGICNELLRFYNQMPDQIKKRNSITVGSGNAIRRNNLLCKILEKKFNCKLSIPVHREEAAFGACLNAIVGSKLFSNYTEVGSLISYL